MASINITSGSYETISDSQIKQLNFNNSLWYDFNNQYAFCYDTNTYSWIANTSFEYCTIRDNENNKFIRSNALFGIYNNNLNSKGYSQFEFLYTNFYNNSDIISIIDDSNEDNSNKIKYNYIYFNNVDFIDNSGTSLYHLYPNIYLL